MRMMKERPGPGMKHTEHRELPADVAGSSSEGHERTDGGLQEDAGEHGLMRPHTVMKLLGEGDHQVNRGDWPQVCPPVFKLLVGVVGVAGWITPVATGGRGLLQGATRLTLEDMPTKSLWTTVGHILHGALVARGPAVTEAFSILWARASEALRQFGQERHSARREREAFRRLRIRGQWVHEL